MWRGGLIRRNTGNLCRKLGLIRYFSQDSLKMWLEKDPFPSNGIKKIQNVTF